jgi:hypothetical protein
VEQAVPLIYTRDRLPPPMSVWARWFAVGVGLACLAVLVTGMVLTPPGGQGIGTHTQLGFPPCEFERRTRGVPCPSCGFTTSVTHFAHGNLLASLYLQPMGFLIALFCAAGVWIGGYIGVTGRPVHRLASQVPGRAWLWFLLAVAIGGWAWKIWIRLTGRDFW